MRVSAGSGWPFLDREFANSRQDGFVALGQSFVQTLGQRIKECLGVDFGLLGSFREGFDQFFFVRMRVSIGLDFIGICQMATMFCWGDVTENESNATA